MLVGHLYIFFGEMSSQSFAHFVIGLLVFLLLSCKNSLYILDTSTLSDIWFANSFSHSVGHDFTFLILFFFQAQMFLI